MKKIIIFRTDRLGDYIIHSRPIYELKKNLKNLELRIQKHIKKEMNLD